MHASLSVSSSVPIIIRPNPPQTPDPQKKFLENFDLTPSNPGKIKILFWVLSSLIHFSEWFSIEIEVKNRSHFHHLFVLFSKNFLIHNVLWLSNVVLCYSICEPISNRYLQFYCKSKLFHSLSWKVQASSPIAKWTYFWIERQIYSKVLDTVWQNSKSLEKIA